MDSGAFLCGRGKIRTAWNTPHETVIMSVNNQPQYTDNSRSGRADEILRTDPENSRIHPLLHVCMYDILQRISISESGKQ